MRGSATPNGNARSWRLHQVQYGDAKREDEIADGYPVEGKRWPLSSSASPEGTAPEAETVAALLVEPDKRCRVATASGTSNGRARARVAQVGGTGGVRREMREGMEEL